MTVAECTHPPDAHDIPDDEWASWPAIGNQVEVDFELELRNCPRCHTTKARLVRGEL